MQTLALLSLAAKITGFNDLDAVTSVDSPRFAATTLQGESGCYMYLTWKDPAGEPSKMFTSLYKSGAYHAEDVSCPNGTRSEDEIAAGMSPCFDETRLNLFVIVTGDPVQDTAQSSLYRIRGSFVLEVAQMDLGAPMETTKTLGTLACVSSACACSFVESD
jgi:hypothetical protein